MSAPSGLCSFGFACSGTRRVIISVCEIGLAFIFGGNRNRRWIGRSDDIASVELEPSLCTIAWNQVMRQCSLVRAIKF